MKKTEFIGITSDCKGSIVGNLAFMLLKNNGFNVAMINNRLARINDNIVKEGAIDFNEFERLMEKENSLDFVILVDLKTKFLKDFAGKYTVDTVIDNGSTEKQKDNKHIIEKKRIMLNCLKRNGISIINNDNDVLLSHFNSLKNKIVINYGLNPKSTITASSLDVSEDISFICCIQRGITTSNGNEIEPMEISIKAKACGTFNVAYFLSAIGLALVYEVPIDNIKDAIYRFNKKI